VAVHRLEFAAPDLKVPRMHPCEAGGTGPGAQRCGATPASLWHRSCGTPGHDRDVWLCGSHAALVTRGNGACRECLDRGVTVAAVLSPADLLLAGHAGGRASGRR
jgi:hypothetical protein